MNLFKNSIQVFITRLFKLAISMGTGIFLARWLQPEGRGAYSLITQFHLIIVAFSGMSIGYASIHLSADNRFTIKEQVSNGIFSSLILSFFACSVVLVFQNQINHFFPFKGLVLFAVIVLVPISILDSYWRAILQSKYKFVWINKLELIQAITFTIGLMILYFYFQASVTNVIIIWSISILICFGILTKMIIALSPINFNYNYKIFREHIIFGIKAHLSTVIGLLSLRFDQYLLGYMTNNSEVGKYAVAVTISELLWFIPSSVAFVLLPRMSHQSKSESAASIKAICWSVLLVSSISALILAAIARPFITFGFGKIYTDSIMALWLMLPGAVAICITTVITPFFLGRFAKPHLGAIVALFSLVSNILLNLFLIPRYGINGAAISSSISYVVAALVNILLFTKACNILKHDTIL